MNCLKCHENIPENAVYCHLCGYKQVPQPKTTKKRGNGQGYVYKRGNKYVAQVTLGYRNGKRVTASKTFAKKSEAVAYIPELKNAKTSSVSVNITFGELLPLTLNSRKNTSVATKRVYESAFKHFDNIEFMKIADIRTTNLQKCVDDVTSPKTQLSMRTIAGMIFKYAIANDIVDKNYAEFIAIESYKPKEREAFTTEEIKAFASAVGKVPFSEYALTLIYTGLRPSEMFALTKESIHYEEADTEHAKPYIVGGSKTEAGKNRIVPLHPILVPIIKEKCDNGNKYLFPNTRGRKITAHSFNYIFKSLCNQIGVRELTPYCCRHTFATLIKTANTPDIDKSKLMGHTRYTMTAHYTHTNIDDLRNVVNAIKVE